MKPRDTGVIITITFADGVRARAQAIHIRQTYGGLVAGFPSPELNQQILRSTPKEVRRVFGSWPVIIIPAPPRMVRRTQQWLPRIEVWSWFESEPVNHGSMCSCLSVVWHQNRPYPFVELNVLKRLKAICWRKAAKDIDY
jgi:hypothetical protein